MFTQKIDALRADFEKQLAAATTKEALDAVRVSFLGKKGPISELMKGLRDMTPDERKEAGQAVNTFKDAAEKAIAAKGQAIEKEALSAAIRSAKKFNPTLPRSEDRGSYHPITLIARDVEDISVEFSPV